MNEGEQEPSRLDAAWGGFNVAVRGSIVVLACLIIADTAGTIWFIGYQNAHFDDVSAAHRQHIERLESSVGLITSRFAEQQVRLQVMQDAMMHEVEKNRAGIREVARYCLLTNDQRIKVQQGLSAAVKDLLMETNGHKEGGR